MINVRVVDQTKENLTQYSESELSLRVFNEECLYKMRHRRQLKEYIDEYFIYSAEQWEELQIDLESDYNEMMAD